MERVIGDYGVIKNGTMKDTITSKRTAKFSRKIASEQWKASVDIFTFKMVENK